MTAANVNVAKQPRQNFDGCQTLCCENNKTLAVSRARARACVCVCVCVLCCVVLCCVVLCWMGLGLLFFLHRFIELLSSMYGHKRMGKTEGPCPTPPPPSTDVRQSLVRHFQRYKMNGRLPRDNVKTNTDTPVISKQDGTSSFLVPPAPTPNNFRLISLLITF